MSNEEVRYALADDNEFDVEKILDEQNVNVDTKSLQLNPQKSLTNDTEPSIMKSYIFDGDITTQNYDIQDIHGNEHSIENGQFVAKVYSASGANPDLPGFTEKNLDAHWGGSSDHSSDYPELDRAGYAQRAENLVRSATDDNIIGYRAANGAIVRYDIKENDYVKGMPGGIKTMFKPNRKKAYFDDQIKKDRGVTDD